MNTLHMNVIKWLHDHMKTTTPEAVNATTTVEMILRLPIAQDVFQRISYLISCTGTTKSI